jgi:ribose/xylose/arabinose/galactoside ABC-type transport system permease subunit
VLNCTRVGKYAYAIGGNEDACRMLGIDVAAYRILLFVISGVCASFAGVLLSSRLGAASGVFAENRALVVIAAIVLGGVHLSGGVGNVGGVVQAVLLLGILDNATVYLRVVGYWEMFVRSVILIGVVVFDVLYIKWQNNRLQARELSRRKAAASLRPAAEVR